MSGDFLPEYSAMPLHGQYVPLYRLFSGPGQDWHQVRVNGRPVLCPTRSQAIEAATEHVRAKLNPPIRAARNGRTGDDLVMDAQVARLQCQADQQQRAFGGVVVKSRLTKVERRRR